MKRGNVKTRTIGLTLGMLFVGLAMCSAQNPMLGTWKLNETKSKIPAGSSKNLTVKYEAAGDSMKATIDGVDGQGKPTHTEWTGKFDGKDYPVTGDPTADTRSIKQVDAHNYQLTVKKAGKITMTGKAVISADGMSRTINVSGKDSMGMKTEATSVYEKQ
ncbi:MAG: hypothetical protein WAM13_13100 [Candidatus Sulfotelmatobacter sp.]|jgi:hypothetical protein